MSSFSWIHLCDLHFGLTGQRPLWTNVRKVLFDDLRALHERSGPWHAVLFTGDLAQSGKPEEFAGLDEQVLGPLWEMMRELGSENVVLVPVPGNHDLIRPDTKKPKAALRQLFREGGFHEIEEEFWTDPACEYREIVTTAFANYDQWYERSPFCKKHGLQRGILPGDIALSLEIPDAVPKSSPKKIGIVGMNTTFLQLAQGDYVGRLAWDLRQIHSACGDDLAEWVQAHDACVLLTHHGPDWLDSRSRSDIYPEINPAGRFAVHLFGHMHANVMRSTSAGGGPVLRYWQGASIFGLEKFGEPPSIDRRHGYTIGRIESLERADQLSANGPDSLSRTLMGGGSSATQNTAS
ncbi:MAG TPA: metallophosphoesterase family protein [Candidatus Angelobacter sp.]|jgi:hypothetical protein